MSEQNGELTLEELVRRLEALERKNAELRGEVATLLCTNVVEGGFCEVGLPLNGVLGSSVSKQPLA